MADAFPDIGLAAADVTFRSSRNWTYVIFFACLSLLHFSIAIPAFITGHWEGYLSLVFGVIFAMLSGVSSNARHEVAILRSRHLVRLRTGLPRFFVEREIPFSNVQAVRITLPQSPQPAGADSRIELLCDNEDVECPPTPLPRQQALMMAIAMDVKLIRVGGNSSTSDPHKPVGGRIWNM
jgi:hypothetical protein